MNRPTKIALVVAAVVAAAVFIVPSLMLSKVQPKPSASVAASPTLSPTDAPVASSRSTADYSAPASVKSGNATMTALRVGAHPEAGYDRIVATFSGLAPAVSVRYVANVVRDGSGAPLTLPGTANLQITFKPAMAHDDKGVSTVTTPTSIQTTNFAGLKSYVLNGDFEGTVSVAIGQASRAGFAVHQYSDVGVNTIYIDVPNK